MDYDDPPPYPDVEKSYAQTPNPAYPPTPYPQYFYPSSAVPNHPSAPVHDISLIRDYLPWSVANIFVGGILPGLVALYFSQNCINMKNANNYVEAQVMSKRALIMNTCATVVGAILWGLCIGLIIMAIVD